MGFSSRRRQLDILRFLQTAAALNSNMKTLTLNMANPSCLIPQDVTSRLPVGSSLSISFLRDPKTYNNAQTPYLMSQVITIASYNNSFNFNFPNSTVQLNMTIPWANVPLNCPNFQSNCNVYSVNNRTWIMDPA